MDDAADSIERPVSPRDSARGSALVAGPCAEAGAASSTGTDGAENVKSDLLHSIERLKKEQSTLRIEKKSCKGIEECREKKVSSEKEGAAAYRRGPCRSSPYANYDGNGERRRN